MVAIWSNRKLFLVTISTKALPPQPSDPIPVARSIICESILFQRPEMSCVQGTVLNPNKNINPHHCITPKKLKYEKIIPPLKFNIAPANRPSQKETYLPTIIFSRATVKLRGKKSYHQLNSSLFSPGFHTKMRQPVCEEPLNCTFVG